MSMTSSKSEPDAVRCSCGRSKADAATRPYASAQGRLVFHRCDCGLEWTERLSHANLGDPVSSDELIEVHQLLARLQGPLTQLLQSV
jgi:hypothetical protein